MTERFEQFELTPPAPIQGGGEDFNNDKGITNGKNVVVFEKDVQVVHEDFDSIGWRDDFTVPTKKAIRNLQANTFEADEQLFAGDVVYPTGNDIVARIRPTSFQTADVTIAEPGSSGHKKVYKIDGTRQLHVVGGTVADTFAGNAYIGTINAGETDFTYSSALSFGTNIRSFDVCQYDTDLFLCIFQRDDASGGGIFAIIIDTSGAAPTQIDSEQIGVGGDDSIEVACAALDDSRVAIIYADNTPTFRTQVLSIAAGNITENTSVEFDAGTNGGKRVTMILLDTDTLLAMYAADASDPLVAKVITISGTVPTVGGSNTIDADADDYTPVLAKITENKVVYMYSGQTLDAVIIGILTIAGTTVTVASSATLSTEQSMFEAYGNIEVISPSVLLTATKESATAFRFHLLQVDGPTITSIDTEDVTLTSAGNNGIWVQRIKPFIFLGIHAESDYTLVKLNSPTNIFIGIAAEDIDDGTLGTVDVKGSINRALSGLTAGTIYYIGDNGRLTTESSLLSVRIGVAFNETSIPVES